MGTFRSLQALARAIGPLIASFGNIFRFLQIIFLRFAFLSLAFWSIGEQTTYVFGGLLLLCPFFVLLDVKQRLKHMRVMPIITVSEVKDE